jgi:hypothetical protein
MVMTRSAVKKKKKEESAVAVAVAAAANMKEVVASTTTTTTTVASTTTTIAASTDDDDDPSFAMKADTYNHHTCTVDKNDDDIFIKRGGSRYSVNVNNDNDNDNEDWENLLSIPNVVSSSTCTTSPTSSTSTASNSSVATAVNDFLENDPMLSPSSSAASTTDTTNADADDSHSSSPTSTTTTTSISPSDVYVSKEDLVLYLLLPTESYDEYQSMMLQEEQDQQDQQQRRSERQWRKNRIQQELDTLLQIMQQQQQQQQHDDEEELFPLEPEAEEALGIAANRVCYLEKYYDVAQCKDVFVPSVAYAIMNGTLLEEAAKHYYGQSEEFLVTYAASLGSAVLSLKNYQDLLNVALDDQDQDDSNSRPPPTTKGADKIHRHRHHQNNEQQLQQHSSSRQPNTTIIRRTPKNETVSDLFLGVASPRHHSCHSSLQLEGKEEEETMDGSTTDEPRRPPTTTTRTIMNQRRKQKIKLAMCLYVVLAVAFYCIMACLVEPQIDRQGGLFLDEEEDLAVTLRNGVVVVVLHPSPVQSESPFGAENAQEAAPSKRRLVVPSFTTTTTSPNIQTANPEYESIAVPETTWQSTPSSSFGRSRSPIAPNLLYYP